MKNQNIIQEQLSNQLAPLQKVQANFTVPHAGWIRAIRQALGMQTQQLAKRLDVSASQISQLERDEQLGNVTLKRMKKIAEGLNCVFVYALLPNQSLEQMIETKALKKARDIVMKISKSMELENQALQKQLLNTEIKRLAEKLRQSPKELWND